MSKKATNLIREICKKVNYDSREHCMILWLRPDANDRLWMRICIEIGTMNPINLMYENLARYALDRPERVEVHDTSDFLKEIASHLEYDSEFNGSSKSEYPYARIAVSTSADSLWTRMQHV